MKRQNQLSCIDPKELTHRRHSMFEVDKIFILNFKFLFIISSCVCELKQVGTMIKLLLILIKFMFFSSFLTIVICKDYKCSKLLLIDYGRNIENKRNTTFCELENVNYKEKSDGFNLNEDDDYLESDYVRQLIEEIKIKSSTMRKIPNTLFMQVPNLRKLDISDVGLRELDRMSFNNAKNLLDLSMFNNQLKSLDDSYFVHNSNLLVLDLSQNQISGIKKNAFSYLNSLETLSLANNEISSLNDYVFEPLVNLRWLWLDRNKITMISSFIFSSSENLKGIYLQNNKITAISPLAFNEAKRLRFLFMTGNSCINQNFKGNKVGGNVAVKYEMKKCILEFKRLLPDDSLTYNITKSVKQAEKKIETCNYIKKSLLDALSTFDKNKE